MKLSGKLIIAFLAAFFCYKLIIEVVHISRMTLNAKNQGEISNVEQSKQSKR